MKLKFKTFGAAREIPGGKEIDWELEGSTVSDLKHQLFTSYPTLVTSSSLLIALHQSYAKDRMSLHKSDEIALIPPVWKGLTR